MCKIPKVVIVAPPEKHNELRRALSSLEYDIAATVASAEEAAAITADAVVVCGAGRSRRSRCSACISA